MAVNLSETREFYRQFKSQLTAEVVAGSDKQLQYNNNGVLGASSNLVFDYTNSVLVVHRESNSLGATTTLALKNEDLTDGISVGLDFQAFDSNSTLRTAARIASIIDSHDVGGVTSRLVFGTSSNQHMTINSSGKVGIGSTIRGSVFYGGVHSGVLQLEGTDFISTLLSQTINSTSLYPAHVLARSRGTSVNSNVIVEENDILGEVSGQGNDGTDFIQTASIQFNVDGTPAANVMPGRITFHTNSGNTSTSEKMRIDSIGNVGIEATPDIYLDGQHRVIRLGKSLTMMSKEAASVSVPSYIRNNIDFIRINGNAANSYISPDGYPAEQITLYQGALQFYNAPAGIGGDSTSLTTGKNYIITEAPTSPTNEFSANFGAGADTAGTLFTSTATGTAASGLVRETATLTERFKIDINGQMDLVTNVGTSDSAAGLSIHNTSTSQIGNSNDADAYGGGVRFYFTDASGTDDKLSAAIIARKKNAWSSAVTTNKDADIEFHTLNDDVLGRRMVITPNGSVWMGNDTADMPNFVTTNDQVGGDEFGRLVVGKNSTHTSGVVSGGEMHINVWNSWASDTVDKGSFLGFSDNYFANPNYFNVTRAAIKGATEVAGNNASGYMSFYTSGAAANNLTEKMRITSSGAVVINEGQLQLKNDTAGFYTGGSGRIKLIGKDNTNKFVEIGLSEGGTGSGLLNTAGGVVNAVEGGVDGIGLTLQANGGPLYIGGIGGNQSIPLLQTGTITGSIQYVQIGGNYVIHSTDSSAGAVADTGDISKNMYFDGTYWRRTNNLSPVTITTTGGNFMVRTNSFGGGFPAGVTTSITQNHKYLIVTNGNDVEYQGYSAANGTAGTVFYSNTTTTVSSGEIVEILDLQETFKVAKDGLTILTRDNASATYNSDINNTLRLVNNNGTVGNFNTITFNNGTTDTAYVIAKYNRSGNNDADLLFSTREPGGGAAIDMRINSNATDSLVFIGRDNEVDGQNVGNGVISAPRPTGTNIAGANLSISAGRSTGSAAGGYLWFGTSPAGSSGTTPNAEVERMRITSDGTIGIGISTLSDWSSVFGNIIQMGTPNSGSNSIASEGVDNFRFMNNVYLEENGAGGNWKYYADGVAAVYQMDGGSHRWYSLPSGSAGDGAGSSFTEVLRIDKDQMLRTLLPASSNRTIINNDSGGGFASSYVDVYDKNIVLSTPTISTVQLSPINIDAADEWYVIFEGFWQNTAEGTGFTTYSTIRHVSSDDPTFAVGGVTVTIQRNTGDGTLELYKNSVSYVQFVGKVTVILENGSPLPNHSMILSKDLRVGSLTKPTATRVSIEGNSGSTVPGGNVPTLELRNSNTTNDTFSAVEFFNEASNGDNTISAAIRGAKSADHTTYTSGYLTLDTVSTGGVMNEVMRVTADEKVGIGVTEPQSTLEVINSFSIQAVDDNAIKRSFVKRVQGTGVTNALQISIPAQNVFVFIKMKFAGSRALTASTDQGTSTVGEYYYAIARNGSGSDVVLDNNVGSQNWSSATTSAGGAQNTQTSPATTIVRDGSEANTAAQVVNITLDVQIVGGSTGTYFCDFDILMSENGTGGNITLL